MSGLENIKAKSAQLSSLYDEILQCHRCIGEPGCLMSEESKGVRRIIKEQVFSSKIFIIAQALGGTTLKLSGLPYTNVNGKISTTGRQFNRFLSLLGYTVYPNSADPTLQYAYCSDIVYCFPGKNPSRKGDRKPSDVEIHSCVVKRFFLREMEIIKPKLIILAGSVSYQTFYRYVLKMEPFKSLSEARDSIVATGVPRFSIGGQQPYVVPIQHPSGANPHFHETLKDTLLISLIKGVLR
jgi:uracil-DNA glycosylase